MGRGALRHFGGFGLLSFFAFLTLGGCPCREGGNEHYDEKYLFHRWCMEALRVLSSLGFMQVTGCDAGIF